MLFRRIIISPTCINFTTTATKRDQHSQSNNCCNQACCFLGLYNGLTGFAYGLIWHGVAWWIMLAVTASRPGKITFSVLCTNKVSSTYMHVYLPRPPFFIQNWTFQLLLLHHLQLVIRNKLCGDTMLVLHHACFQIYITDVQGLKYLFYNTAQ